MLIGCSQQEPASRYGTDPEAGLRQNGITANPPSDDSAVYQIRYGMRQGESEPEMRERALLEAAKLARARGHSHFAIIEEGTETSVKPGSISGIETRAPLVRSQRRGGRGRTSGGSVSIALGGRPVSSQFMRVIPYSGTPPEGAIETHSVSALQ